MGEGLILVSGICSGLDVLGWNRGALVDQCDLLIAAGDVLLSDNRDVFRR